MRAFIAIELPINIKNTISKIQDKLKNNLAPLSWVKPQNLHLTLKFLGGISPEQCGAIDRIITEIAQTTASFKIKLDDLGVFPNLHNPRILWIGTNQDLYVQQLAALLETKTSEMSISKETRNFSTHITIARIKSRIVPADLEKEFKKIKNDIIFTDLEFTTQGLTLFESILDPQGPTYAVLKEANFRTT